ncbi:MAG: tRNA lysidine(34) synthetase TilS [Leadbetterella sp.]|nr:tRNA lysidine(34) synthetase TilS [Leadbetterella sp.]
MIRERDHWLLTPKEEPGKTAETEIPGEGIYPAGKRLLSIKLTDATEADRDYSNPDTAFLDAEKLAWPLRIRLWKNGDRFVPFGMKGSRLVSDYLKDRKVNASEKKEQWVVEDSAGILWLAGHRIADPYKVTAATRKILKLELEKNS